MGTRQEELDAIGRNKKILKKLESLEEGGYVGDKLSDIKRELLLTRKGNEAFVYGEEVEDSDEIDLGEVLPEESE